MRQLLAELTSGELTEWMAFDSIDPIGEARSDLRMGVLTAAVVNHGASPPKQPARAVDFMPFIKRNDNALQLADPVKHGRLIANSLFGDKVKRNGTR